MININLSHISYMEIPGFKSLEEYAGKNRGIFPGIDHEKNLHWVIYFNSGLVLELKYKKEKYLEYTKIDEEKDLKYTEDYQKYQNKETDLMPFKDPSPIRAYHVLNQFRIFHEHSVSDFGPEKLTIFEEDFELIKKSTV